MGWKRVGWRKWTSGLEGWAVESGRVGWRSCRSGKRVAVLGHYSHLHAVHFMLHVCRQTSSSRCVWPHDTNQFHVNVQPRELASDSHTINHFQHLESTYSVFFALACYTVTSYNILSCFCRCFGMKWISQTSGTTNQVEVQSSFSVLYYYLCFGYATEFFGRRVLFSGDISEFFGRGALFSSTVSGVIRTPVGVVVERVL